MSKLAELRGELDAKRQALASVFEEAGENFDMDNVKSIDGDSAAKAERIRSMNDELTGIAKEIEDLQSLSDVKDRVGSLSVVDKHPGRKTDDDRSNERKEAKTFGDLFLESKAGEHKGVEVYMADIDTKTLFDTAGGSIAYTGATSGWFPMDVRTGTLVDYFAARQPLRVADLVRTSTTSALAITYMQEQSFTNTAVEVTAGSAKPEAALDVVPVTETVRKIAVWIPVTDEQLADVPQVRSYLTNRLGFMVRQRLDSQMVSGNGTAPNLKGILNRSGIQTQAKGADPVPDAVYKAITKIAVNDFSVANGVVFHPNDWQDVKLLRTADGIYIWGSPADNGPDRIWGLPVAITTAMTENTAIVGDFNQAELAMREGLTFKVTDSHSDYFIRNIQVVLAELRAAFLVYREAAFCKVTGI